MCHWQWQPVCIDKSTATFLLETMQNHCQMLVQYTIIKPAQKSKRQKV